MIIDTIITSVNDDPVYVEFVPIFSKLWGRIFDKRPIIMYVTPKSEQHDDVKRLREFCEVRIIPPVDGINRGVQAKVSRMVMASTSEFATNNCMLVDIDMLPLSADILEALKDAPLDNLIQWGYDHPTYKKGGRSEGKWPMDRTCARGDVFAEIVNPDGLAYEPLLRGWMKINKDGKESTGLPADKFSDESLLRYLHGQWPGKDSRTHKISRLSVEKTMLSRRLDRTDLSKWNNIEKKLENNELLEVHCVRPFKKHFSRYEPILNFFNITKEEVWL